MTSYTYKTPKVQRSIEGYIQRTSTTERAPRGGSSIKEGEAATRKEKKSASSTSSSSDSANATIINYSTVLPR